MQPANTLCMPEIKIGAGQLRLLGFVTGPAGRGRDSVLGQSYIYSVGGLYNDDGFRRFVGIEGGACSRWGIGRLQCCIYVREGTISTTIDRAARCSFTVSSAVGKEMRRCEEVSGHFSHHDVSPQPNLGPSQSLAQENLQSRPPTPSEDCLDKAVAHLHGAMCAVGLVVGWMVGCVVVPSQSDVLPGGQ